MSQVFVATGLFLNGYMVSRLGMNLWLAACTKP